MKLSQYKYNLTARNTFCICVKMSNPENIFSLRINDHYVQSTPTIIQPFGKHTRRNKIIYSNLIKT